MNHDVRVKKQEDITSIQFDTESKITKGLDGIFISIDGGSILLPKEAYADFIAALLKAEEIKWIPPVVRNIIAPTPRVMLNETRPGANLYGSWIPENTVTYNQQTKRGE